MNRLKSQLHFLYVLKDAKPQAKRALLTSPDNDLIKAIVELQWTYKIVIIN
jgi:hypothetical protein